MLASLSLVALSLFVQTPADGGKRTPPPPLPTPTVPTPAGAASANPPAPPTAAPAPVVVRHVFLRHHDRNGDGRLDPSELPRKMVRQFAKSDANGDGFLDANEVVFDRHALGRNARRMEDLDIDRNGKLFVRGKGEKGDGPDVREVVVGVLQRVDRNGDGVIEGYEVGETIRMDVLPLAKQAIEKAIDGAPQPEPEAPPAAPAPKAPDAQAEGPPPQPRPTPPANKRAGKGGNELPSAEETIRHLDKDGDGQLSQTEAVDQLAKNFRMLDKNKDGRLSREEIDRGLKLARMFGVKPMRPPTDYAKEPPANQPPPSK